MTRNGYHEYERLYFQCLPTFCALELLLAVFEMLNETRVGDVKDLSLLGELYMYSHTPELLFLLDKETLHSFLLLQAGFKLLKYPMLKLRFNV